VKALELELEVELVAPTPEGVAGDVELEGDFEDGVAGGKEPGGGELPRGERIGGAAVGLFGWGFSVGLTSRGVTVRHVW